MNIQKNIPLAYYTTFGIGGPADFFIEVSSSDELKEAVQYAREKKIDFFVLGTGANILVGDKGFRGLVIRNKAEKYTIEGIKMTAESGMTVHNAIVYTVHEGLSGFEHFAGIPSSIGGALWQNLHFLSPDRVHTIFIETIFEKARILTSAGEEKEVSKEYFAFGYDYSILRDTKDIVLSATFRLEPGSKNVMEQTFLNNYLWRKEKHPENAAKTSAGSIFKKIEGHGAGRLIEQVGLKGYAIGGATISSKHANFIVNTGNASAKDVRDLIAYAQKKVKEKVHLELQPEISFIGEF